MDRHEVQPTRLHTIQSLVLGGEGMKRRSKIKILIVGNHLKRVNPINFISTLIRNLKNLGIDFSTYDLSLPGSGRIERLLGYWSPIKRAALVPLNRRFVEHIVFGDFTHILVIKGVYLLPEALVELREKKPSLQLVCCNTDDPFNVVPGSSNTNILESVPHYDSYFIWSRKLAKDIDRVGGSGVYWPFAADTEIIRPSPSAEHEFGLSFVGNGAVERLQWVDEIAAKIEEDEAQSRAMPLHLFGVNWTERKGLVLRPDLTGPRFVEALVRSKINLNFLRPQNRDSTNLRTFEIPASATLMLHERSVEAEDFFKEGKEAEYFESVDELVDKARYFLSHDLERERIAKAGFERVSTGRHSYADRVSDLVYSLE